jgi:hypothetical protein
LYPYSGDIDCRHSVLGAGGILLLRESTSDSYKAVRVIFPVARMTL